jgi:hypothetical protein
MTMLRPIALLSLVPVLLIAAPAQAVTNKDKMETCKIGADSQELKGAKRNAFIKKCMGAGNYEPPARTNAAKTVPAPKPQ